MKVLIIFYFLSILQTIYSYNHRQCQREGHEHWVCNYMLKHNRTYSNEAAFRLRRSKLLTSIRTHSGVEFGLTSRSDRFNQEMKANHVFKLNHHLGFQRKSSVKHTQILMNNLGPIDWRNHKGVSYVTPVKDQGDCGDCFAFASATVLEYWSKRHGFPKSLSSQTIMDCTSGTRRPDVGCQGGLMEYVYEYAKHHPVPLESQYPYFEKQKPCPRHKLYSTVKVYSYKVLLREENPKAESQFEAILHKYGPISVGIDSSTMDDYKSGVFPASLCTTDIDHAVAIVGYTKDAWIIKNSWGKDWGQDGYLYLERGKNACGVAEYAVYIDSAIPVHQKMSTKWSMVFF